MSAYVFTKPWISRVTHDTEKRKAAYLLDFESTFSPLQPICLVKEITWKVDNRQTEATFLPVSQYVLPRRLLESGPHLIKYSSHKNSHHCRLTALKHHQAGPPTVINIHSHTVNHHLNTFCLFTRPFLQ